MNTSTRNSGFLRRLISTVVFLACFIGLTGTRAAGQSAESFLNRMSVKFRQTGNIYLKARSHRVSPNGHRSDTMDVTLAYGYPDRLLQWVRAGNDREQIILYSGDTVVVSYPHIDVLRRKPVDRARVRRMILRQVPFAAVFVGLASDEVSPDSITVEETGANLRVSFRPGNRSGRRVVGLFHRENLRPVSFRMGTRRGEYRVKIMEYTEETRFPGPVERAINQLRPELLKERQP